jgi:hypothetical protein
MTLGKTVKEPLYHENSHSALEMDSERISPKKNLLYEEDSIDHIRKHLVK